jgi:hypothetical protein
MTVVSKAGSKSIDGHPSQCPFCHHSIMPNIIYAHADERMLEVFMDCPNCNRAFIGYYEHQHGGKYYYNGTTTQGRIITKKFSETIKKISESFVTIYNQSFAAEQQALNEICGVGYRKALEFLIKDYLIIKDPKEKEKVEKIFLSNCIEKYVSDVNIKSVSKRAAWLGNDETHYIRKWEGKNLQDLKKLIDLTVHWIEMEDLTKSFESEMPEI